MLHTALIAAHAACGLAAFVFGIFALEPRTSAAPGTFGWYLGALCLMILFLAGVVALDWKGLDLPTRVLYAGLLVLAGYVGWRGWRAAQNLSARAGAWRTQYIEAVGFTPIALFDGFVIVSALDLGAPGWIVVALGVLGIVVGRFGVQRAQDHAASFSAT
jgi:hypothetical protein